MSVSGSAVDVASLVDTHVSHMTQHSNYLRLYRGKAMSLPRLAATAARTATAMLLSTLTPVLVACVVVGEAAAAVGMEPRPNLYAHGAACAAVAAVAVAVRVCCGWLVRGRLALSATRQVATVVVLGAAVWWVVTVLMAADWHLRNSDVDEVAEAALAAVCALVVLLLATGGVRVGAGVLLALALTGPVTLLWFVARVVAGRVDSDGGGAGGPWALACTLALAVSAASTWGGHLWSRPLHKMFRSRLDDAFLGDYRAASLTHLTHGPLLLLNATVNDLAPTAHGAHATVGPPPPATRHPSLTGCPSGSCACVQGRGMSAAPTRTVTSSSARCTVGASGVASSPRRQR